MRDTITYPENPLEEDGIDAQRIQTFQENPISYCESTMRTPQPYFVSGYTGWTPGAGPRSHRIIGQPGEKYTHRVLHGHRVAGGRLNPLNSDLKFVNSFVFPPPHDPKQILDNPHMSIDPYFLPGYTGFTPGSCIKRSDAVGETYGRMTHLRLANHETAGNRLRPIYEEPHEYIADAEEVKFYCNKHELTANDLLRRSGTIPGYTGHMPRARFRHGKTGTKIGNEATAEFERLMEKKK